MLKIDICPRCGRSDKVTMLFKWGNPYCIRCQVSFDPKQTPVETKTGGVK